MAIPLIPPKGGAIVRMYRIGHGDCFLIAFDGKTKPVFVLIDCGYKPGSPCFDGVNWIKTRPDEVVADIKEVTNSQIDVAVITHEHQDHVNAITEGRFEGFVIGQTWFAWTESDDDKLAKLLRKKHNDRLRTLQLAFGRLAGTPLGNRVEELIAYEIGGEDEGLHVANGMGAAKGHWTNKDSMKLFRTLAKDNVECLYPHRDIKTLPGTAAVRVYALGPPYDERKIHDLDPKKGEGFPQNSMVGAGPLPSFAAAMDGGGAAATGQPFSPVYAASLDSISGELDEKSKLLDWFSKWCGRAGEPDAATTSDEVASNAKFRRIDQDWLQSSEQLAITMGNDTNNSSLVLAFELGKGGKVLLFAGDAQRGNWVSWAEKPFKDGDKEVDVRELLGRTVLYKVGHHGSHNATLAGKPTDTYPNLSWFGRGKYGNEVTAMITAVRKWAMKPSVKWDHPLKAIKEALHEQCAGRVFQTDTDFEAMAMAEGSTARNWEVFKARASGNDLYFDLVIEGD